MDFPSSPPLLFSPQTKKLLSMRQERWGETVLSDFNAVAEGEADAAVGVDRCMIQQFSPGLRIECRHLLRYKGAFTDADKVLLTALKAKLMSDTKLQTMAKTSDPQIFAESIFPKAFGTAAQDSYMESQDTYTTLFEDQAKYNAIMRALGSIIYREMRART